MSPRLTACLALCATAAPAFAQHAQHDHAPAPKAAATPAMPAAARRPSLAAPDGCRDAVDARPWIADAPRAAGTRIRAACRAQAALLSRTLASHGMHPVMVNAAGEAAWRAFDAVWARELTAAQRARVAALTEHGAHHGGH